VIVDLPRDSRDIYSFLYLNPNITRGASEGSFKFIGAQSYGASFSLDGQRANGGVFGEPTASQPSLETIGELTVLSNSFSAEYAGIANVRITTRRGGSEHHGSLFYNNKNSALGRLGSSRQSSVGELRADTRKVGIHQAVLQPERIRGIFRRADPREQEDLLLHRI
jgi:hypothetical protein